MMLNVAIKFRNLEEMWELYRGNMQRKKQRQIITIILIMIIIIMAAFFPWILYFTDRLLVF